MTHAEEYFENNPAAMRAAKEAMPDIARGFASLYQATMKPGALSLREKELIALGIGVAVRCENCIYSHISSALKAGASREQILETAGVAVTMAGGPGYTYLPRVVEALDALQTAEAR